MKKKKLPCIHTHETLFKKAIHVNVNILKLFILRKKKNEIRKTITT